MRLTDSSNLREQLQETVIRMNDLFKFSVPFFTILEDNGSIHPMFDLTSVKENSHSAVAVEYDDLDEEHRFENIEKFIYHTSFYNTDVSEVYALQNAGKWHTLLFKWNDQTLTMEYNPITRTYRPKRTIKL